MNKTTTFFVDQTSNNLRLDKYLASKLKILTRSQIKKIIISKSVKLDKKVVSSPSQKIKSGNLIEILIKTSIKIFVSPFTALRSKMNNTLMV